MAGSLLRLRRSIALFSLIMAGALIIAIAPTAISADDDTRSIEQFQPITISERTFLDLEAVAEDLDPLTMFLILMQLEDLGEFDTNLDQHNFSELESLDQVNNQIEGNLSEPGYLPPGFSDSDTLFGVTEPGYATATINVEVGRNISQLLDLPPEWLPDPAEHETVTLSLDVPAVGLLGYSSGLDKLVVGQLGLPHTDIPDEVDLDLLREAILDDPRVPDELADQLGAIDNWEETVPVPVPEGATYENLDFDGNPGFVLTMDDEGGVLAWVADGIVHLVAGNVSADELQQIAESIQ